MVLARAGLSVTVLEAAATIGGGTRTEQLTLPGFAHDVCSAVHPFGAASPFFSTLPLQAYGLEWIEPPHALAHPFDNDRPALLDRSIATTAGAFGDDERRYRRLMEPLVSRWDDLAADAFGPLLRPSHPFLMARFGIEGLRSVVNLARKFSNPRARALIGGIAAHSVQPLHSAGTAAAAILLGAAAHRVGWPIPRRGSSSITTALASYLTSLGGRIETGTTIRSLRELPAARSGDSATGRVCSRSTGLLPHRCRGLPLNAKVRERSISAED